MSRCALRLLWILAIWVAATCVIIDAKNTKGKNRSKRRQRKATGGDASDQQEKTIPNVTLTSEEMCDACRVTVNKHPQAAAIVLALSAHPRNGCLGPLFDRAF